MAAWRGLAVLGVAVLAGVGPAGAQEGWYVTPSLSLMGDFDSNIFSTSSDEKADVITRVTPGVALQYVSGVLTLAGRYSLTGEVYADNSDLSGIPNGHSAGLDVSIVPTRVLTLGVFGAFDYSKFATTRLLGPTEPAGPAPAGSPGATGAPGVAAPPAGGGLPSGEPVAIIPSVDVGRQASTVLRGGSTLAYAIAPRTNVEASYTYVRTETEDLATDTEHEIMAGVRYQLTPLDGTGLRYTLKRFEGASPETSHVIAPEWERRLTARTTASVSLGPRFSEEAGTGAEASASLRHDFQQATASMAYRRTQQLVTGRAGAQATDALTGDVSISLLQNLTLFVRGMFLHTSVETPPANDVQVYAATVNLTYQITAWARARIAYGYYFQQQDSGDIRHHIVSVGLDLTRRFRVR